MIIKDVTGEDHRLTKTFLAETVGHASGYPFRAKLMAIKNAMARKTYVIQVYGRDGLGSPHKPFVTFYPKDYTIGCRTFSPATFAKILKAAGVKTKTVARKRKKVSR